MNSLLERWNKFYVDRTPHMLDIGTTITSIGKGCGTMLMPARPAWLGDLVRGWLHPGALTVLADSACGLAVGAALEDRVPYATLDLRMDYLRPASPKDDLYCEAECYRLTRSVAFTRGTLWQGQRDEPVASVQATFMLSTLAKVGANIGEIPQAALSTPNPVAPAARATSVAAATAATSATSSNAPVTVWQPPMRSEPVLPLSPIPYVEYLGIRVTPDETLPLFRMPFQEKLIGNPTLPALHGGVVAGFAETAATLHLIQTLKGTKFPKSIDFSIDYLRSGRPEETFANCELVRVGGRVALVNIRCWQKSPDYPIAVARALFLLTAT